VSVISLCANDITGNAMIIIKNKQRAMRI